MSSSTTTAASPQRRSLRPKKALKPTARAAEAAAMNDYECVEPMPRQDSQQRRKVSTLYSLTVTAFADDTHSTLMKVTPILEIKAVQFHRP